MSSPRYKLHTPEGTFTATCKDPDTAVRIAALLGERASVKLHGRTVYRHITDGDADESIDAAVLALLTRERIWAAQALAKAHSQGKDSI